MTIHFPLIALSILVLFPSIPTVHAATRREFAYSHLSTAARLCVLFIASALALVTLTGCGGMVLYRNVGTGGNGGGNPHEVATPTFSPAPGTYTSTQQVTIRDRTPGATIYYT